MGHGRELSLRATNMELVVMMIAPAAPIAMPRAVSWFFMVILLLICKCRLCFKNKRIPTCRRDYNSHPICDRGVPCFRLCLPFEDGLTSADKNTGLPMSIRRLNYNISTNTSGFNTIVCFFCSNKHQWSCQIQVCVLRCNYSVLIPAVAASIITNGT